MTQDKQNENQTPKQENSIKGITLIIDEATGRVKHQMLGHLNEAELLGFGAYLQTLIIREGMMGLSQNQVAVIESLKRMIEKLNILGNKDQIEEVAKEE